MKKWFIKKNGEQKHWLTIFSGFYATLIFGIFGLIIIIVSLNNSEQIEYLQKIYMASDSTYKATRNLNELPKKIEKLSFVLPKRKYLPLNFGYYVS
mgnify:FL=1